MKTYLVDTNVFIQIKNYFGLDVCEGFWEWMIAGNVEGKVFSVEKVAEELTKGNDELADWAKNRGSEFFLSPDQKVIKSMRDVSGWVHGQSYTQAAVDKFLAEADYFLVSHALAYDCVVVTYEVRQKTESRVKIPNVCQEFEVECVRPYEMLKDEGVRFVLAR